MKQLVARVRAVLVAAGALAARALDVDLEDVRFVQSFVYGAVLVLAGVAVAGLAVRVFLVTSGLGG